MDLRVTCLRALFFCVCAAGLPAAQIVSDPSDFSAFDNGGIDGPTLGDLIAGDTTGSNNTRRPVLRFSLAGLAGHTIQSASLTLFLIESRKDQYPAPGIIDGAAPFTNPGLGDTVVLHIADYGIPSGAAYGSASIGNDPGILIAAGAQPGNALLTIDVKAAMQQAIDSGFSFVTFRVQTAIQTDGDGLNDTWAFGSANWSNTAGRPVLDYASSLPNALPPAQIPEPSALLPCGIGLLAATRWRRRPTR